MAVKLETLRRGSIADFSTATTSIGTTGYLPRRTRTAHVFLPPTARGLQQADPVSGEHRSTQHTIGRRSWRHYGVTVTSMGGGERRILVGGRRVPVDRV